MRVKAEAAGWELPGFPGGINMNFKFCSIAFKHKARSFMPTESFLERRLQEAQDKGSPAQVPCHVSAAYLDTPSHLTQQR